MSHHSEEALFTSGSDSFWEPGNYKRTVKRTEDSFKLCNDLIQLIAERAEIEKAYAKNLKTWSKKWSELIERGPEYGTIEAACKSVCEEADKRCDLHLNVRDKLLNDVVASIKQWQKDSFHKTMMYLKEKKEFEDNFKKVQKPWAKLLDKVTKAKQEYHQACKNERSAINQERNASGDTSLSPDQVKKLQERVVKCKEEVTKCREKYEASLREITEYNPKYQEDMTDVFEKCQEFEEKRLSFFRETLFSLHACLDISTDANLASTYADMKQVITVADASKDLKWWSQNHGTGMPTNWPVFEEYTPDLHNISKKERKIVNQMINHDSVTLTHVNHHPLHSNQSNHVLHTNTVNNHHPHIHPHSCPPPISASSNQYGLHSGPSGLHSTCVSVSNKPPAHLHSSPAAGANHGSNGICNSSSAKNVHHHINDNSIIGHSSSSSSANRKNAASNNGHSNGGDKSGVDANPFDDEHEDWDEYPKDALIDNGEAGVPVRALYDYEGAEADELSFKQGDEFEKLEDEDEQGWCKGRKDGRVGLYPANYVEPIPLPLPVK